MATRGETPLPPTCPAVRIARARQPDGHGAMRAAPCYSAFRKEGATSVVYFHRNGAARFHFSTAQMSAFSTEDAAGQQRGAQRQPQKQRANRTVPTQKPTTDAPIGESESLLNKKQQKSADRLQKYNLEMTAILGLKFRLFMLRALKRARYERVWSVVTREAIPQKNGLDSCHALASAHL